MSEDRSVVDKACPHCGVDFPKPPTRKTACKSCGRFAFVRTRPRDRKRVLVTEEQAKNIDRDWKKYREYQRLKALYDENFEEERVLLRAKFNGEPGVGDVIWSLANKQRFRSKQARQWGLYRNATLNMGDVLRLERRFKPALRFNLEVAYFDLVDPVSLLDHSTAELLAEISDTPPIPPEIASGVLNYIDDIQEQLAWEEETLEDLFFDVAKKTQKDHGFPLSAEDALKQFIDARRNRS